MLTVAAAWGGQQANADYVGAQAGAGPDGIYDDLIRLPSGIPAGASKIVVTDDAFATGAWEVQDASFGGNSDGYAPAYLDPTARSLSFNPTIIVKSLQNEIARGGAPGAAATYTTRTVGTGDHLTVRFYDASGNLLDQTGPITAANPNGLPAASAPAPALNPNAPAASGWSQSNATNLGWVHLTLATPPGPVASMTLTDPAGVVWSSSPTSGQFPLVYAASAGNAGATDVSFPPLRDEGGAALSLRVTYGNGANPTVTTVAGGFSDPALTGMGISGGVATLQPSNDPTGAADLANLRAALNNYANGTIVLGSPGASAQFTLDGPLVLDRPVTLVGAPGASIRLNFVAAPGSSTPWQNAIDIRADNVTLGDLDITIGSGIRWLTSSGSGTVYPAAIGSTGQGATASTYFTNQYARTTIAKPYLVGTTIDGVALTGPPRPANPGDQEPNSPGEYYAPGGPTAPYRLFTPLDSIDLGDVYGGRLVNSTIRGGQVVIQHGPWTIAGNDFRGAVAGTVNITTINVQQGAFDLTVTGNHVHQVQDGGAQVGRTYGFLILAGSDYDALYNANIAANTVDGGVGLLPQDRSYDPGSGQAGDGQDNHPEVTAFESYNYLFVGKPLFVADGTTYGPGLAGRVLVVPTQAAPNSVAIRPGDVVSVLSGRSPGHEGDVDGSGRVPQNQAGEWAQVVQVLGTADGRVALLLDRALPTDPTPQFGYDISINRGVVGLNYRGNTIDLSGTRSVGLVLTGNDFGTIVADNRFTGGNILQVDGGGNLVSGAPFQIRSSSTNSARGADGFDGIESYAPSLGTIVAGNVITDAVGGGSIGTYDLPDQAVADRTFLTASVANNTWRWSDSFVASVAFYSDPGAAPVAYPTALGRNTGVDFPILSPLTIGGYRAQVDKSSGLPASSLDYRFRAPSKTVGRSADARGYDVGPAGFVDPMTVVVDLQGNTYQFLDAGGHPEPTYLAAHPGVAAPRINIAASTINSYRQVGAGVVTDPNGVSAGGASIAGGGPADTAFYSTNPGGVSRTYGTTHAIDTSGVAAPLPQSTYQNQRYVADSGSLTYTIPNLDPHLTYLVRLDFAEIYFAGPNQRLFSIRVNGQLLRSSFDIFAAAGGADKAIALYTTVQPDSSGRITIALGSIVNNAEVQGINVAPFQAVDVGQDGTDHQLPGSPAPDGVVDEHLVLTGLRPDKAIDYIAIKPIGGGGAVYVGPISTYPGGRSTALYLPHVAADGTITADLYFQTFVREIGQNLPGSNVNDYQIDIKYVGDPSPTILYNDGILNDPALPYRPTPAGSAAAASARRRAAPGPAASTVPGR